MYKIPLFIQLTVHPTNSPSLSVLVNHICRRFVCLSDSSKHVLMAWYLMEHRDRFTLNFLHIYNDTGYPGMKFSLVMKIIRI